ncbi:40970_t:CDS:2, partial [Gigaspora margarita]
LIIYYVKININPIGVFTMALLSLISLCKIIRDVTEALSKYTSKNFGILIMMIFGNLPDLIMMGPFFSKDHSEIVHGMIIGNLVSTSLLLVLSKENKSDSNNEFNVSIDINNESACLKINFNILVQLFILAIASVIVFLVSNMMKSLVEDLLLSENFFSIIVLGFIGSVPEHATSINSFYKNNSDSGLNHAFGSNLMMLGGVLPIFTILG